LDLISIRKIPATNSIPPTPLIKGGKGGSLIPKFKGNDITPLYFPSFLVRNVYIRLTYLNFIVSLNSTAN
jgi:hypothetical protein